MRAPRLAVIGLAAAVVVGLQIVTPDGVHGSTFLFLVGDDTAYAPGFTESRFARVHVGEPGAEVRRVLGEPLDVVVVTEARLETWHYTRSPGGRHYRLRAVVLEGGIVVDKISEAYVD